MNTKLLYFGNSYEWRNWLSRNHDKENEAWLIIYKNHNGKTGIRYCEALEQALDFGWIDDKIQSINKEECILRFYLRKARNGSPKIKKGKKARRQLLRLAFQ